MSSTAQEVWCSRAVPAGTFIPVKISSVYFHPATPSAGFAPKVSSAHCKFLTCQNPRSRAESAPQQARGPDSTTTAAMAKLAHRRSACARWCRCRAAGISNDILILQPERPTRPRADSTAAPRHLNYSFACGFSRRGACAAEQMSAWSWRLGIHDKDHISAHTTRRRIQWWRILGRSTS